MQLVEGSEPLQRGDLVRTEVRDRHHAGTHGRAVDEHRAGAALCTAAPEFRAIELEIVAQHVEHSTERVVPLTVRLMAIVIASPRAESWGVAGVVRPGFCVSFIL